MKPYLSSPSTSKHPGPPLTAVAFVYAALVVGGIAISMVLAPRSAFVMPFDSVDKEVAHVLAYAPAARWGSFFQLCSAMPLLVVVAATVSRLHFLGVRAAGTTIALCGGIGASLFLVLSAIADWSLSFPGVGTLPATVRALQLLGFAAGGPAFVVPLGLFFLGVSITAGLSGFIPRWLMWFGIVIGVASELATLTLVTWNAAIFIPVGRYLGIVWMILMAFNLPVRREA